MSEFHVVDLPQPMDEFWRYPRRFLRAWLAYATLNGARLYSISKEPAFWPIASWCVVGIAVSTSIQYLSTPFEGGLSNSHIYTSAGFNLLALLPILLLLRVFRPRSNFRFFLLLALFSILSFGAVTALVSPLLNQRMDGLFADLKKMEDGAGKGTALYGVFCELPAVQDRYWPKYREARRITASVEAGLVSKASAVYALEPMVTELVADAARMDVLKARLAEYQQATAPLSAMRLGAVGVFGWNALLIVASYRRGKLKVATMALVGLVLTAAMLLLALYVWARLLYPEFSTDDQFLRALIELGRPRGICGR